MSKGFILSGYNSQNEFYAGFDGTAFIRRVCEELSGTVA